MSDIQQYDPRFNDGTPAPAAPQRPGQATMVEQARAIAEVRAAVMIAMDRPRDRTAAVAEMREVCTITALAERAFFRVPRGGEHVNGESIHLARELARCWGNLAFGVKELARDDIRGQSELLAYAWDLQTNARSEITFIVPHVKGKANRRLTGTQEIYENNASFAGRRLRETIFAVLPVWFKAEAAEICHATLANGGGKPLVQRIADLRAAFEALGVGAAQLERKRGRRVDEFLPEDVAGLRVVYGSIKRGEVTVAEEFPPEGGPAQPPAAGGKLDALEILANPTTAEISPAAPKDEDAFGLKPLPESYGYRTHTTNSPPTQQQERSATDGFSGPAPGGEPDQSTSRPASSPGLAAGHPGVDKQLPAFQAPVEGASRRGDEQELGQSLGAVADERLTSNLPALGNRENAANVSDRPQSDLLAAPALENLTVPLPARPTVEMLDHFARQMLHMIGEGPPTPQRSALIRKENAHGIGLLKSLATAQYDEVMAALAKPAGAA